MLNIKLTKTNRSASFKTFKRVLSSYINKARTCRKHNLLTNYLNGAFFLKKERNKRTTNSYWFLKYGRNWSWTNKIIPLQLAHHIHEEIFMELYNSDFRIEGQKGVISPLPLGREMGLIGHLLSIYIKENRTNRKEGLELCTWNKMIIRYLPRKIIKKWQNHKLCIIHC